ncbi:SGNH/GDSL hydrolase family protein [Phormidesmis sp. 146-33]
MFRTSRKTYRSGFSSYQKKKKSLPRWLILGSIPLILIGLELMARVGVGLAGKTAEFAAYEGEPLSMTAYRLRYLDRTNQPYDGLPDRGRLKVRRSSLLGYKLVGNQQSNAWRINEQGFRMEQAIAPTKPKDEVRIFVLGGSTAFGQLSSSNQATFANQLETRFNQQVATQKTNSAKFRPDVLPYYADELTKAMALPPRIRESRYRVINAAVPGYASSNQLAQLTQQVLAYKPDYVVIVDGYADLLLPSTQEGADVPGIEGMLENASGHFTTALSERWKSWFNQSYLVKSIQYWLLRPQDAPAPMIPPDTGVAIDQRLPTDTNELNRRVSRYRNNLEQIVRLTTSAKIPLIVALQPEITSRTDTLTQREKKILSQLGSSYPQQVKSGYKELQQSIAQVKQASPQGVTALNLYDATASLKDDAFHDPIHLTDKGNEAISNKLYESMANSLTVQPKPFAQPEPPVR